MSLYVIKSSSPPGSNYSNMPWDFSLTFYPKASAISDGSVP